MSRIPLDCNVCSKTFSGPVPAQDHFRSREHIKKMEASKQDHRSGFACHVCNIKCDTMRILEQHNQSPRHNANAEKQRKFNQFGNELPTGNPNYAEFRCGQGDAYLSNNTGMCNLCNVAFNSPTHAQSHLSGKAHKKKLAQFEALKASSVINDQRKVVQASYHSSFSHTELPRSQFYNVPRSPTGDYIPGGASNLSRISVLNCDVCGVPFSGPDNAKQHYASEKHKKKANQGFGSKPEYSCSLCNVIFTGPENEECHKLSQKHKKNVELMEKKARGEVLPLSCYACNCRFSGQENAEAHFQSKKHKRNIENMNIQSEAMHRENDSYARGNPSGGTTEVRAASKEKELPHLIKPVARRPEESTMFGNSAFTQYIRDGHGSSKDNINQYHSIQDTKSKSSDIEESDDDEILAKPVEEENTSLRKISLEEDLIVKPIENDEDSLIIKPVDTEYDSQYRQNDDDSVDIKSIETDTTPFDSMRSEGKIKAETYTSIEQPFGSLSLTTGDFSSRETEPVRYVQNDLRNSITPIGRGRGIFTLLREQEEKLPGKVMNTKKLNNVDTEDMNMGDESETKIKSVWSGTRASPSSEILLNGDGSEENDRHQYNIPPQSTANSGASGSTAQVIYQRENVFRPLSRESDLHYEMEEYVFDPVTGRGKCYICDIDFTSSKHKSQHIVGKNHLKAREVRKEMATQGDLASSSLICILCSVTFSGFEAKQQHMKSEKHKRKEMRHLNGEENDYFCDICNISCSGPESFTQHQMGAQHRRLAGISPPDGSGLQTPNFDRTKWYPCEVCKCNMNTYEQLKIHESSPRHMKQLEKQVPVGLPVQGGIIGQSFDRTKWFPCEICSVSMNTFEQLKIHEKSPRHLKQLEKRMAGDGTLMHDRTIWYPCHVCNCKMNTEEQLRIHEASPAHVSKLRQSQGIAQTNPTLTRLNQFQGHKLSPDSATPLESFLSEELFPEEFLPRSDSTDAKNDNTSLATEFHDQLKLTDKPFYMPPRFAIIPDDQSGNDVSANAPGTGGTKHGHGSELAYATRSRGERESSSKKGSSASSAAEDYSSQGARPKQTETSPGNGESQIAGPSKMNPTMNNPYASTHRYYCHTCKSPMNTREAYENHLRGKRHMQKVCTEQAPGRSHLTEQRLPDNYLPFTHTRPRNYQQELYKKAMEDNTLCFLPTGTGKTLVAVMTISAMLEKCPSKNVLFLVDKVLLVLQQSKYIRTELGDIEFHRFNPDSDTCMDIQRRVPRIAAVCMGQQTTNGLPLWKHDIVVVTAAFCQNLLDKQILRWEDFSLVVIDEAHHCEKAHPFNTLLSNYHKHTAPENKPKVLGLTASPAGKADVPKTLQMLLGLVNNMGDVRMTIVEEHENVDTLNEFQSNAQMVIRSQIAPSNLMESSLKQQLNEYIMHCVLKLYQISNIRHYIEFGRGFDTNMADAEVKRIADDFVDKNFDMIQSSLNLIENENEHINKVQFSQLCMHIQSVCMALSCLEEGGVLIALQELEGIETEEHNFDFARRFGLPTAHLQQIVVRQDQGLDGQLGGRDEASSDLHMKRLIDELTDGESVRNSADVRRMSLVLVKQRCTAHLITKVLQKSERMRSLGLNTTCVVGHGGSGAADKGMNVNQQKRVLEEIKLYKYQVIVATSVAEEGVDWPECERVVSLYPPSTVTALVQMRGRARRKNSKFIVLCANLEEEEKIHDIMQREKNMIAATRLLIQQNRQTDY